MNVQYIPSINKFSKSSPHIQICTLKFAITKLQDQNPTYKYINECNKIQLQQIYNVILNISIM